MPLPLQFPQEFPQLSVPQLLPAQDTAGVQQVPGVPGEVEVQVLGQVQDPQLSPQLSELQPLEEGQVLDGVQLQDPGVPSVVLHDHPEGHDPQDFPQLSVPQPLEEGQEFPVGVQQVPGVPSGSPSRVMHEDPVSQVPQEFPQLSIPQPLGEGQAVDGEHPPQLPLL